MLSKPTVGLGNGHCRGYHHGGITITLPLIPETKSRAGSTVNQIFNLQGLLSLYLVVHLLVSLLFLVSSSICIWQLHRKLQGVCSILLLRNVPFHFGLNSGTSA
jgi:hypothetical protein